MWHKCASVLPLFALTILAGCSDKLDWMLQPSEMPEESFSVDCTFKDMLAGSRIIRADRQTGPARLTVQINPEERYYRVTSYSGSLPDYSSALALQDLDLKAGDKFGDRLKSVAPSTVPYIGTILNGVQKYRFDKARKTLVLYEVDRYGFKDDRHSAIPYMGLDIVNRSLRIALETRDAASDFDAYQRHQWGSVVAADFQCARSPKNTVIEVAGFTQ